MASSKPRNPENQLAPIFAASFGVLLGLSLLKFGNPIVLEKLVETPAKSLEIVFDPWPARWGHWLLGSVALMGLFVAHWKPKLPKLLIALPLLWLVWEVLAATQTVDANLSHPTVIHFATCAVCFYLGLFCLSGAQRLWPFWLGLFAGLFIVLMAGFDQHFGGLEETRRYFQLYNPDPSKFPPDYLKRVASNRIFSTLFYANTLAGVILLLLPVGLGVIASLRAQLTLPARRAAMVIAALPALACLYWSGSKTGWLLMLLLGLVALLFQPIPKKIKLALVTAVLVLGLAGFALKYAGFFKEGATSVVARIDYWRAAAQITAQFPLLGTGPGTFGLTYPKFKNPEAEMTRLTHNDYLEQACDSGIPGAVFYTAFVATALYWTFRHGGLREQPAKLAVWLGLMGWALHCLMEFHLYIPATAWPAFALMGWLLGGSNRSTPAGPPANIPAK